MDPTSYQGEPHAAPQGRLDPKQLPSVRSLGKGLSGFIYETTWLGQGRYARKDFPLRSLKRTRAFEEEAKVLLELDHPNLVRCLGYTVGKSSSSLLQEYVDDDLQNVVQRRVEAQRGKSTSNSRVVDDIEEIKGLLSSKDKGTTGLDDGMPWGSLQFEMREAEDIISQIAAGMKYLHDKKITHGDLKPKNVLLILDESGKMKAVKIVDHGLEGTKKLIRLVSKRTRHFEILTWKAPELFEELLGPVTEDSDHPFTDSDIDSDEDIGRYDDFVNSSLAMADVYSFGLTCSYILGAKLLFPELSLTQLRTQRVYDSKGTSFLLPPTCPSYLQSMIASCLQSDPVSRPTFSAICNTLKGDGGVWRSPNANLNGNKREAGSPSDGSASDLHRGKMKVGFTSHIYKGEMESGSASDQLLPAGPHSGDWEVKPPESEVPSFPGIMELPHNARPQPEEKASDVGMDWKQKGAPQGKDILTSPLEISDNMFWTHPESLKEISYKGEPHAAPQGRLDPKQLPSVRSLGKGLSGFIYETTWLGQGRYARKDFPLRSLKRTRAFEEEAKVLLELDHPNLVRCLGYTVGKNSSSLLQEYVDDDLQNVVQRRTEAQRVKPTFHSRVVDDIEEIKGLLSSKDKGTTGLDDGMPWGSLQFEMREAEDIISQIAAGMKYLHDKKITHGDLKPKNVLLILDESGKMKAVKIVDHGLEGTKKLIRLVSKRTRHFEILTWKAPELFEELLGPVTEDSDHPFTDSDIDSDEDIGRYDDFVNSSLAMADVYSFGLTCSYILGAKLLFPELSLTQLRAQRACDSNRISLLLPPTCPKYLQSMIASCLQSDPVSRPTFSAICNTLKEAGRPIYKGEMEIGFASDQLFPAGLYSGNREVKPPKLEDPLYPFPPLNLPGIEENMTKLEQMLEKSSKVGVVGVGGIGKTTLVKELYRRKSVMDFEASSILFDVCKYKDVLLCQQALLLDIGMDGEYDDLDPPHDKEAGKYLLQTFLSKRKVLIVLDDVGEDFIDYLLPAGVEWHMDSKIILTSHASPNLKLHVNEELEMQFLGRIEAMELFCMHAFKENSCPDKNLQEIINDIVDACGQLPLSLEVVGSFLSKNRDKKLTFWKGVLKKLKKAESLSSGVDMRLQNILKICFDDLGESKRGKFLDVACFFCSELCSNVTKDMALVIWGPIEEGSVELQDLIERHLVTINERGFLSMHDQLLAMGRNILKTESQYKHTRVLDECEGLRFENLENLSCLEGLYLANKSLEDILSKFPPEKMMEMHKLRILIIQNCDVPSIEFLSTKLELKQLQYAFILDCSLETLPSFSSTQMMTMYMAHACHRAKFMDDFIFELIGLTTLDLRGCTRLYRLPPKIGQLKGLTTLNLEGCTRLWELPTEIGQLTSLTTLNLEGCENLRMLPATIGQLTGLTTLNLEGCKELQELPAEIGQLTSLTTLNLEGCTQLLQLPAEIGQLTGLTTLNLVGCENLRMLPNGIGQLTGLTTLNLEGCEHLRMLPATIGQLTGLTTLNLEGCKELQELPAEIGQLTSLTTLNLEGCRILWHLLAEIGQLTGLTTLNLEGCENLRMLPATIGQLTGLTTLNLEGCKELQELPAEIGQLTGLTTLNLEGCKELQELPAEIGQLTGLTTLNLEGCKELQELPAEIGQLTSLTTLNLEGCTQLLQLPAEIGQLTGLTTLNLEGCEILWHLPAEIGQLTGLTTLNLEGCKELQELLAEISQLTSLTTLNLEGCTQLLQLPAEIGQLTGLTTLNLVGCENLRMLPNGIGQLTGLTTLNLEGCEHLRMLLATTGQLTSLTTLNLEGCKELQELLAEIGQLTGLTT